MNKNLLIGIAATLMPAWMQAQSEKPKNVLFIAVDDLNDWVGFLKGHPNTRTPNMDRLSFYGICVWFDQACFLPGLIHNRPDQWIWGAFGFFTMPGMTK